jgi:hypothetical protein
MGSVWAKPTANIEIVAGEKNSLAFFATDTCLVAKFALFLQSF